MYRFFLHDSFSCTIFLNFEFNQIIEINNSLKNFMLLIVIVITQLIYLIGYYKKMLV